VQKSTFTNAKARAWETFVQRWDAKTEAHENGMLDVFLMYFSEAYQEAAGKKRL
jgi:type VI secretion system protein ImpI